MSVRSKAPGDEHDGGYKRPFTVVPDESLEQVRRDVTATFHDVPLWSVAELFARVHKEMGSPDVGEVSAALTVEYGNLTEEEFEQLTELQNRFWMHINIDVTKTRLYPSREGQANE